MSVASKSRARSAAGVATSAERAGPFLVGTGCLKSKMLCKVLCLRHRITGSVACAGGEAQQALPLTRLEDLSEDDYEDPADDPELIALKT